VISCQNQKSKHLNFQYIYLISYKNAKKGKPSEKDLPFYYFFLSDLSVNSFIRSLAPKAYTAIAKTPSNKPMQIAKNFMIIPLVLVSLFQLHISSKRKEQTMKKDLPSWKTISQVF